MMAGQRIGAGRDSSQPAVVSLLASATEIVCGLGLAGSLVAISHECDFPPEVQGLPRATSARIDSTLPSDAIDRQVADWLRRGEPLYAIDEPLLRRLRPGVILTQAQCDVCAIRLADVLGAVARTPELAGAEVLALQPNSLTEMLDDIGRVAQALDCRAAGNDFRAGLEARINAVRSRTEPLPPADRPRTFLLEWTAPPMAGGNWTPELLDIAGGTPGLATPGQHSGYVSWDEIAEFDPEVLLIAPCGFDLPRTLREITPLQTLPQWRKLSAVRSGRAFALDGNAFFNRSGPRLVDSLEIAAWLLHPQLFSQPKAAVLGVSFAPLDS